MKKDPLEVSNNDDEEVDDKILSSKSDRIFDPDSKDYMESDNENEEQENEMDKNEDFFAKENNVSDSEGEDEISDEEDHNIKVSQFCFKFLEKYSHVCNLIYKKIDFSLLGSPSCNHNYTYFQCAIFLFLAHCD